MEIEGYCAQAHSLLNTSCSLLSLKKMSGFPYAGVLQEAIDFYVTNINIFFQKQFPSSKLIKRDE